MESTTREITLRFLASPTDIAVLGRPAVAGGRVLEWIDKAAYACAAGWSGGYCVTAYVGNVNFVRAIRSGELVEVHAILVLTGRSSMHIDVTVTSSDPRRKQFTATTSCTVVFMAVSDDGRTIPVPQWSPVTAPDIEAAKAAAQQATIRRRIEAEMTEQTYLNDITAHSATLRFLAAPTDVNWGGKAHGGIVMRWIDEAGYACASGWSGRDCIAVYSGGIRFYRPILIGHLVEIDARLVHTGRSSMQVSIHVRTADPKNPQTTELTTHCLAVFVALDSNGYPTAVQPWVPEHPAGQQLSAHAQHLMRLRSGLEPADAR